MKRSIILFLFLVIACGHGAGANASAVQLRNSTTTEYAVIRVSDIFNLQDSDKFGKIAGTIVGAAPAPGRKKF